jgi:hypothetical protein
MVLATEPLVLYHSNRVSMSFLSVRQAELLICRRLMLVEALAP